MDFIKVLASYLRVVSNSNSGAVVVLGPANSGNKAVVVSATSGRAITAVLSVVFRPVFKIALREVSG